jgi:hypothetical protein
MSDFTNYLAMLVGWFVIVLIGVYFTLFIVSGLVSSAWKLTVEPMGAIDRLYALMVVRRLIKRRNMKR